MLEKRLLSFFYRTPLYLYEHHVKECWLTLNHLMIQFKNYFFKQVNRKFWEYSLELLDLSLVVTTDKVCSSCFVFPSKITIIWLDTQFLFNKKVRILFVPFEIWSWLQPNRSNKNILIPYLYNNRNKCQNNY